MTLGSASATVLAVFAVACGGSTATITEITGPNGVRCQTGLSPAPQTVAAGGDRVTLTVIAARECSWTASSEISWAQVSPTSGQGQGPLTVTVAANPEGRPRSGGVLINDNRVTIAQEAAPCRFELGSSSVRMSHEGGRTSAALSATPGCEWRASSNAGWARVLADSGTGSSTVEIEVSRNDGPQRRAVITVADRTFEVVQDAVGTGTNPTPSPTPPAPPSNPVCISAIDSDARSFDAGGGDGRVRVAILPGCAWTASENVEWIAITAGATGSGPGPVEYRVATNSNTNERTATITVAGRTHTVRQAGVVAAAPQHVEFEGTASNVSGSCPSVSFTAAGRSVYTDGDTKFKGQGCRDLREGVEVEVVGYLMPDGRVRATKVDVDDD